MLNCRSTHQQRLQTEELQTVTLNRIDNESLS